MSADPTQQDSAAKLFARIFRGADGDAALAYLRRLTIEKRTPPDASNRELRYLEGQRALCLLIETLVKTGRNS